jgi:tryptophan-rich sensory protein
VCSGAYPVEQSQSAADTLRIPMRRSVLRVDAVFLTIAGLFGLVSDLQSYTSGSGPFGQTFYRNPTVIGVVEAHALAMLTAGTLWFLATHHTGRFGHWVAIVAHAVMGGSNLVWFEVFTRVQAETQGIAVTVVHFAFVAVNAHAIFSAARRTHN